MEAIGHAELVEVVKALQTQLSTEQQMILRWAVRHGLSQVSVADLAEALRVDPRTVRRWCDTLTGITPNDLLSWARILHASRLLSHSAVTLAAAAAILRFSSPSDLRRKFKAVTGAPLHSVERPVLLDFVVTSIRRTVEKASS
jgi:transcriptional regulator GlxA family with amidase domain